jgi:hypothetical protein
MPAARAGWAVLAATGLAVSGLALSACSIGSDGHHSKAWDQGFQAGKEAQEHHPFKPGPEAGYERTKFCAVTAFNDIQKMNHDMVQWTEGFDSGCHFLVVVPLWA